ncbi:MAG TPA: methyltransferase domain-containing protein [Ilumatobacteraceae bacterium]
MSGAPTAVPRDSPRSKFAGGDQAYLRERQYVDGTKLDHRANLHKKYRTAEVSFFDWIVPHLGLAAGARILEAGCGTGRLWTEAGAPMPADIVLTLTDLSPGMVAEATQRVTASGRFAMVTGRVADLQQLPFADCEFDIVVADHMLYHLPQPALGVAELARVLRPNGRVVASTNGSRHMREIWQIRAEVFGTPTINNTVDVFGAETGFPYLRDAFESVHWFQANDELRCTDPADVLAYICSMPPGEDATIAETDHLRRAIDGRFAAGGGVMTITKDAGCFVCEQPFTQRSRSA